jgi:hypothetical protein
MIGRSKKCLLLTFKRVQWKRKQHVVPCVVGLSTIRNVGFISVQNVRPSRRYDQVSSKIKTLSL